jgi:hypothetical protein
MCVIILLLIKCFEINVTSDHRTLLFLLFDMIL